MGIVRFPDPTIESLLRDELRRHSQRWSKTHASLGDDERQEMLGRMTARRLISEARDKAAQLKDEADERDFGSGGVGTLQHGTGGGHRVIRSTKPFS
jgi:hypothetical protein